VIELTIIDSRAPANAPNTLTHTGFTSATGLGEEEPTQPPTTNDTSAEENYQQTGFFPIAWTVTPVVGMIGTAVFTFLAGGKVGVLLLADVFEVAAYGLRNG
jgi:hypothetical protein